MEQRFIEDELIILTKQTMDSFLNSDFKPKGDLIQLYIFYYYTSKWQKTNQVKCTTSYAAQGLEISEARVRAAKKELTNLGLIEDVKTYDGKNRISGHYVLLRYKFKNGAEKTIHPPFQNQQCGEDFHPHEKQQGGKNDSVEKQRTNAYSTNNINAYSTNNINAYSDSRQPDGNLTLEEKEKRFLKPTIEEIRAFCKSRKNGISAERFFDYYESNGWRVGRTPMKNWQAAVRSWERNERQRSQDVFVAKNYETDYEFEIKA